MSRLWSGTASGWGPELTNRVLSLFRTDARFTDEEILMILYAGEGGLNLAEVCAAGGIRVATYFSWQAKYNGLTPAEVRRRRQQERKRRRGTTAAVVAAVSVGGVALLMGIPSLSLSHTPSALADHNPLTSRSTAPMATVTLPGPAPNRHAAAPAAAVVAVPAIAAPAVHQSLPAQAPAVQPVVAAVVVPRKNAEDIKTSAPGGYAVQVAAVPDLREARAVLEQLGDAGYQAYLTATTVDRVELYRVRVGPFKSRPVAEEMARRLERDGHRAAWVTK
jgi:putative transposase